MLVIGAQCGKPLAGLEPKVKRLAEHLTTPGIGDCLPALDKPYVLDPDADELDTALVEAFRRASARRAVGVL